METLQSMVSYIIHTFFFVFVWMDERKYCVSIWWLKYLIIYAGPFIFFLGAKESSRFLYILLFAYRIFTGQENRFIISFFHFVELFGYKGMYNIFRHE